MPETMYLIDHTNATKVFATSLGNGADGEVILHVPESNAFYHWSGNSTMVFEKFKIHRLIRLQIFPFLEPLVVKHLEPIILEAEKFL